MWRQGATIESTIGRSAASTTRSLTLINISVPFALRDNVVTCATPSES
jgi:hypothetical protein